MTTPDLSDLLVDIPRSTPAPRRARFVLGILAILILTTVAVAAIGISILNQREAQLYRTLQQRLSLQAESRAEVIDTWMDGTARLGTQLVNSDLFRLFATESGMVDPEDPLAAQLSAQAPYMAQVMTEFVRQNGLAAAYVIGADGRILLASGGAPPLSTDQSALAAGILDSGATVFAPVTAAEEELLLDIARPILEMQPADPDQEPAPAATFLMTLPVTGVVADFLAPRPLTEHGEVTHILQIGGSEGPVELTPEEIPPVRDVVSIELGNAAALPFGERPSVGLEETEEGSAGQVFSVAASVSTTPWLIVQEIDRSIALAPLDRARNIVLLIGCLAVLVITGAVVAVWSFQESSHNKALATQYRDLAARIDAQRRLLDGINGAIREYIGLKRPDGAYTYVNPAFARAVERPVDRIIGSDDAAVFGHATAQRLAQSDRTALETGAAVAVEEQVYLGGNLHYLEISKVPLRRDIDGDGQVDGIVSVARDVTELVEQRRRREATLKQAIRALVRTVELSDPYLAGHARLVQEFSLLVGRRMGLGRDELSTLEISASLAQLGKLFVPRAIVAKPDRLTPEEIAIMQTHIDHASTVLRDIDFDLPVHDTIYQMYERLDGTGYPRNLTGTEIGLLPRILGAVDVFSARIRARSYRGSISPEAAVAILADNDQKYDIEVVAALRETLATPEGERLIREEKQAAR